MDDAKRERIKKKLADLGITDEKGQAAILQIAEKLETKTPEERARILARAKKELGIKDGNKNA